MYMRNILIEQKDLFLEGISFTKGSEKQSVWGRQK